MEDNPDTSTNRVDSAAMADMNDNQALAEYYDDDANEQNDTNFENDYGVTSQSAAPNNLIVLDPDHPLMERFQKALKDQLLKREQKLTLENRETKYQLDKAKQEREDLGVELYTLQQELAKMQMLLEKEHDMYNEKSEQRKLNEEELQEVRKAYRDDCKYLSDESKKVRDLQQERDNIKLKLFYMNNAKDDIRGDIAVIRRATEKAESEKSKIEVEKQRQDLIVNRLEEKESKLKEDIALYEYQLYNQEKESKIAKQALVEARMETEAIEKEKNQLMQNWSSCLIGMKRRDEALAQMNQAIRAQRQKSDSSKAEIDSYKKSIIKEQEKNESLTIMINQRKTEIKNLEKLLKLNKDQIDNIQDKYSKFSRALKETETMLTAANTDKSQKQSISSQLQREIEKLSQEKVKIEDEIFKKLQDKLTADKAAKYSDKLRKDQKEKLRELERNLAKLDNEIAKARLEALQTRSLNESLDRDIKMCLSEIEEKNKTISKSESEIRQRVLTIEQKQNLIDQYNKRIESMIEKAGGVELGPLELEEKNLNKEIDDMVMKIMELEQKWLREQNELVRLVKELQAKQIDYKNQNNAFVILSTKKMRVERNIESEQANIKNLNRSLDHLRLQLEKLNKYIFKETDTKNSLERNYELASNEYVESLKAAEKETIQLQNKLEQVKSEKEKLLADLIETDNQIMMWEKRVQLAKEMKAAVDSEAGQGEVKEMKFEIHRMKVRYAELLKQQEKLVREMESAVLRRDTILTRGEFLQKNPTVVTQGKVQREIADIQKKIKETNQEANKVETEIRLLKDKQQQLANVLTDKQMNLSVLRTNDESKSLQLDDLLRKKQLEMDDLLGKQRHLKYYEQVKQSKYKLYCKQENINEQELNKQLDRLRSLGTIVTKLGEEFPNLEKVMRKIEQSIQTRLNHEEENGGFDKK